MRPSICGSRRRPRDFRSTAPSRSRSRVPARTATRAPTSRPPERWTGGTSGSMRQRTPTEARQPRKGTIARPGQGQRELALDLAGRVARRRPAAAAGRLRVPALDTDLTGTYEVDGPLSSLKAEAVLGASTVEGATLAEGTPGRFAARRAASPSAPRARSRTRSATARRRAEGPGDDRAATRGRRQRHLRCRGRTARPRGPPRRGQRHPPTPASTAGICRRSASPRHWTASGSRWRPRDDRGLRARDDHRHGGGDRRLRATSTPVCHCPTPAP